MTGRGGGDPLARAFVPHAARVRDAPQRKASFMKASTALYEKTILSTMPSIENSKTKKGVSYTPRLREARYPVSDCTRPVVFDARPPSCCFPTPVESALVRHGAECSSLDELGV